MDNSYPDKIPDKSGQAGFKATFHRAPSIGAFSALRIDDAFAIDNFQIG